MPPAECESTGFEAWQLLVLVPFDDSDHLLESSPGQLRTSQCSENSRIGKRRRRRKIPRTVSPLSSLKADLNPRTFYGNQLQIPFKATRPRRELYGRPHHTACINSIQSSRAELKRTRATTRGTSQTKGAHRTGASGMF